jgi:hypothetical protein
MARRDDPLAFVISVNLKRRHLTESQRAMVGARIANLGRGNPTGTNQHERKDANLHDSFVTREQAADLVNVSPRSVATAARVVREAPATVADAVKAGAISLNLAAKVAGRGGTLECFVQTVLFQVFS